MCSDIINMMKLWALNCWHCFGLVFTKSLVFFFLLLFVLSNILNVWKDTSICWPHPHQYKKLLVLCTELLSSLALMMSSFLTVERCVTSSSLLEVCDDITSFSCWQQGPAATQRTWVALQDCTASSAASLCTRRQGNAEDRPSGNLATRG